MPVTVKTTDTFSYTSEGALVVSEEAMQMFAEEWADEFLWLSQH